MHLLTVNYASNKTAFKLARWNNVENTYFFWTRPPKNHDAFPNHNKSDGIPQIVFFF